MTVTEFITIHMLFSYLNAWITYQLIYTLLWNIESIEERNTTDPYHDIDSYYRKTSTIPAKIAFIVIFFEMSINLTYYKDVVFSFCTLINYIGMFEVS